MKFKSSYDTMVMIITTLMIGITTFFMYEDITISKNIFSFQTVGLVILIIVAFLLSVKDYSITPSSIEINKIIGKKNIELIDIVSIERIIYLDSYIRIFGIGGLFGYNGVYLSKSTKFIYLYTNHKGNLIKINRNGKSSIYISPDDPLKFIECCRTNKIKTLDAGDN